MRNFRKYEVWSDSAELAEHVFYITRAMHSREYFTLHDQLRKSAISIPSNIAEGCARTSQREFKRFIEIALGSAFELETQLLIAKRVTALEGLNTMFEPLEVLQKKLNSLRTKLK